jgi:TolB-like protein
MLLVVSAVAEAEQSLEEGLHELAVSISATMRTGSIRKIAVVEFTDLSGYPSVLGQFVAEELITQLFNVSPGQFDVVERRQLAKVLREQKLAASGLIDPDSISRVGRLLGIQAIVTGSITDLGSQIKLNARLIAVESGKVFAAAAASVTKDAAAERLLHQSAGVESSPASGPGGDLARQRQASDVFFQNSFLRVEVKSLAITKNGTSLSLALSFKNLSPSDLFLGLKGGNCYSVGSIGSDTGLSAAMRLSGLPCINNDERSLADSNNFTAIGPGSETTIVLSLFSAFGEISGNLFAFSLPLVRLSNGNLSSFTVGIANIELLHGKR